MPDHYTFLRVDCPEIIPRILAERKDFFDIVRKTLVLREVAQVSYLRLCLCLQPIQVYVTFCLNRGQNPAIQRLHVGRRR